VISLERSLRDVIAINLCCFRYKGKKQKPVTLSCDDRRTKICCPRYVGKSKYIHKMLKSGL